MKLNQSYLFILCLLVGVTQLGSSRAEVSAQMGAFITEQIALTSQSLGKAENACILSSAQNESFYLQNFLLRVRAHFGIDVPLFLKFQIVPELELVFQRSLPEGWGSYRPN